MNRDNQRQSGVTLTFSLLGLLVVLCTSCSRLSSKERHLRRADDYFASGSYPEAEIEYTNVLKADRQNGKAIARLGIIFFEQGSLSKATPFLLRANELENDDLPLKLKLGQLSLLHGDTKNARDDAIFVLSKSPSDPDAPILLAEAAAKSEEIEDARQRLTQLPGRSAESAPVLVALATLDFKQHRADNAEESVKRALALDPKSSPANYAMGTLLWLKKDTQGADKALEAAYKSARSHSPTGLKYAQFKIQINDLQGARRVLEEMIHAAPDYVPALILLAELDANQNRYADAAPLVSQALQRDPANPEAVLLGARIKLAQGEAGKAIADLERLNGIYQKYAPTYYLLGQAYLAEGDLGKAISSLEQAISINPGLTEAVLLLASTNIKKGDFKAASLSLTQLLQKHRDIVQALLLEAEALRGQGDLDGALEVYLRLEKSRPKDPEMALYVGLIQLQQDKRDEAREAFNRALRISPAYLAATEQLINVDLIEGKFSSALERANHEIERDPVSDLPRLFLAKIYLAQDDKVHAEAALLKAIELKPDNTTAYFLLAELYQVTNRQEKALADLKQVLAKNPKDLGALMMMGAIYETQKNYSSARDSYEETLVINPRFSAALNNLAYLYSERFDQVDKGFDLAQKARELLPNEPHTADTLGWILYRKHQYSWALGLLEEGSSRLPTEADVQFHVGMVHYMMGEEEPARTALQRALALPGGFAGSDEAKQRLDILALDPSVMGPSDRAAMEKLLATRGDDPIALARLAVAYERDGAIDKAAAEFQAALKLNPANVRTMLNLARLYGLQHDTKRALELAKEAHKQEPDDPVVSQSLSELAYQTGDYEWAYSLIHEAVRSKPEDPQVQFDLANAAFSIGKLQEADEAISHALKAGVLPSQVDAAKRLEATIALIENPAQAALEAGNVDSELKLDPGNAAVAMVQGEIAETRHDISSAVQDYEKVLQAYPDFSPAKRRLAVIYCDDPGKDERTSELAISARDAYPADPDLSRVLGIVAYRKKNFVMAAGLLQESAQQRSGNAEVMFYLGMSQYEAKDLPASRKALQQALDLGLDADHSAEARKTLALIK